MPIEEVVEPSRRDILDVPRTFVPLRPPLEARSSTQEDDGGANFATGKHGLVRVAISGRHGDAS
jgi:hypothetical protein